jgi:hypothetical protein
MKRLIFLIVLVLIVVFAIHEAREHRRREAEHTFVSLDRHARDLDQAHRRVLQRAAEVRQKAARAAVRAGRDVRKVLAEVDDEIREALAEAGEDVREALAEAHESVDDIPVPIVPGTRVADVRIQPPAPPELPEHPLAEAPPEPPVPPSPPAGPGPIEHREPHQHPRASQPPALPWHHQPPTIVDGVQTRDITGLISATKERAVAEARKQLEADVAGWIEEAGVPRDWTPSPRLIDAMIRETKIETVVKEDDALYKKYGHPLYVARLWVDASPASRATFVDAYHQQRVRQRLILFGGGLGFLLVCLGAVAGYIRADEATRGYYTNRLRLLAAAGVGAAGAAIYHMVA